MSIKYSEAGSSMQFYIPPTLASDFDSFLNYDVPNMVMNFTLLHDWYEQFEQGYQQTIIRGQIYPDSTKSRYSNTDNNLNFRASVTSGIRKGDIVIDQNNDIYVLDWAVKLEHNNAPSRALRCNEYLTIQRFVQDQVDDMGYVTQQRGYKTIVDKLPCNMYRYDGRPQFSAVAGTPGITPNALTLATIQYNDQTKNIAIGDTFVWGKQTYLIIDINRVGVSINDDFGTMTLQARKASGGELFE